MIYLIANSKTGRMLSFSLNKNEVNKTTSLLDAYWWDYYRDAKIWLDKSIYKVRGYNVATVEDGKIKDFTEEEIRYIEEKEEIFFSGADTLNSQMEELELELKSLSAITDCARSRNELFDFQEDMNGFIVKLETWKKDTIKYLNQGENL